MMDKPIFKALYGSFDKDMMPIKVIDVTTFVAEKLLCEETLCIRAAANLNQMFADPHPHQRKFLQIKTRDRMHNIIEDHYEHDIVLDLSKVQKRLKIVYYAYINRNSNWRVIVSGQLLQLKSYGLLDEADLFIHITDTTNAFEDIISFIHSITMDVKISTSNKNHFEYDGIKLVYDVARQNPDAIIIYFHTKGISYNIQSRTTEEYILLKGTFEDWRRKLQFFNDERINKMGLFPAIEDPVSKQISGASGGWIWFNFWYARANYMIKNCIEPGITTNRYYFEGWLAGPHEKQSMLKPDCKNLHLDSGNTYFTAKQACAELNKLVSHNN
jgi:hypothetical protein